MIYLDHNATTPLAPEALEAMTAALRELPGNPSSTHAAGRAAREAVEQARAEVAALIGASPEEIVFTSGGTEANDLAIRGTRRARGRTHAVSSPLEHPSVLGPLREGPVSWLPVGAQGELDPGALPPLLQAETALLALAVANHELGNVTDVRAFAEIARAAGVAVHADAVQAAGKLPLDVAALPVDTLSLSAHKLHGPKGVGALFVRRGAALEPVLRGGHQERERRAGTENVAGIVGMARALELALTGWEAQAADIAARRDRLVAALAAAIPGLVVNGAGATRLPNNLSIAVPGVDSEQLLVRLDLEGVAVSAGSACASGAMEISHVVEAIGLGPTLSASVLRLSLGRATDDRAATRVAELLPRLVQEMRPNYSC